jgi:hypothetical protein
LLDERLLADGTNQNVEEILGNHGKHSTPNSKNWISPREHGAK